MEFQSTGGDRFRMMPGAIKEIRFALTRGERFERQGLPIAVAERTIMITAEADGIPLGGMTYVVDADYVDPNKGGTIGPHRPAGRRGDRSGRSQEAAARDHVQGQC
jgi:hypothetical protein